MTSYAQEKNSMWLTNIDQAIAQSMETEKPIMLFLLEVIGVDGVKD